MAISYTEYSTGMPGEKIGKAVVSLQSNTDGKVAINTRLSKIHTFQLMDATAPETGWDLTDAVSTGTGWINISKIYGNDTIYWWAKGI
jgi:hypothetical protein